MMIPLASSLFLLLAVIGASPAFGATPPPLPPYSTPRYYGVRLYGVTVNVTIDSYADIVDGHVAFLQTSAWDDNPKLTVNLTVAALAMRRFALTVPEPFPDFKWRCRYANEMRSFLPGFYLDEVIFYYFEPEGAPPDADYTVSYSLTRWQTEPADSKPLMSLMSPPEFEYPYDIYCGQFPP